MEQIVKAGAFVIFQGRFIFVVGPDGPHPRHGVVRLGGHRESGESPLACAIREVREEASLQIEPVRPPATYWATPGGGLAAGLWAGEADEVPPLLVTYHQEGGRRSRATAIYLAYTDQAPRPAMETRGLLLLAPDQVRQVAHTPMTLRECLAAGGEAILQAETDLDWPLHPSHQVKALDRLMEQISPGPSCASRKGC